MVRTTIGILLGLLLACGGSSTTSNTADCTLIPTPDGLFPKACVHEVPSGATVSEDGGMTIVTLNGSVVATYPPCPCPR